MEEEKINKNDDDRYFTRDWFENQRIKGSIGKTEEAVEYIHRTDTVVIL